MASSLPKHLTILGGSGFLGRRIAQTAILNGYSVTALSRSGKPPATTSPVDSQWVSKVNWRPANIFQPDSYKHYLEDSDVVVHSIGVILEKVNYKKVVNGPGSGFINTLLSFSGNKSVGDDAVAAASGKLDTYEKVNHESAVLLAEEYLNSTKVPHPKFVYISADNAPAIVPGGYMKSKRAAEFDLMELSQHTNLTNLIVRPGFMFDETDSTSVRSGLHKVIDFAHGVPGIGSLVSPSISTQQVAKAIFSKLEEGTNVENEVVSLENLMAMD
ncbi:ubiquinone biosynthesis protein [Saccharomycopsis crataegensis]|uniref:Ubiquinone biosynthesis protein n=1 Tax=Saccharomycopsis crataegensis TaxID=43959 RepID=A0AAV5QD88_9ASCO|nr:ubiquinone biosynthesis protein [Saccharomycopsis crataegensis]